jgi:hypothetical protein
MQLTKSAIPNRWKWVPTSSYAARVTALPPHQHTLPLAEVKDKVKDQLLLNQKAQALAREAEAEKISGGLEGWQQSPSCLRLSTEISRDKAGTLLQPKEVVCRIACRHGQRLPGVAGYGPWCDQGFSVIKVSNKVQARVKHLLLTVANPRIAPIWAMVVFG